MNKWKQVAALALAGITALGMSACGGSANNDAGTSGNADGSGELTVAIWDTYQEPGLKMIMESFTEKTGIPVKIQVTP
jgi:multiple sugar transport system substrate-binding protein